MSKRNSNEQEYKLEDYVNVYLENRNNRDELEIRFATKANYNPLKKITFDNTIQKLRSIGFEIISENKYHLNIQNEYINPATGTNRLSNIRTTIDGLHNIQKYCKTNIFDIENIPQYISFMQKFHKTKDRTANERFFPIDYHDWEFRVNFKEERTLTSSNPVLNSILNSWQDSKKTFRLIKRTTLKHPDFPFKIDCSILKTSSWNPRKKYLIPTYSIQESNVFNNIEHYELELELINNECYKYPSPEVLTKKIRKGVKFILSGLQNTNFPISYKEIDNIRKKYLELTLSDMEYKEIDNDSFYNKKKRKSRKYFIGPSSISLEMNNIVPLNSETATSENINLPYSVTEKADGARKLLYIAPNKKVYLIDINLQVEFTGLICKNLDYLDTLIDGEHVLYDKRGEYLNSYLCFDIYWQKGEDVRIYPFAKIENLKYESKISDKIFRYNELVKTVTNFDLVPVSKKEEEHLSVSVKTFYLNDPNVPGSIFSKCNKILEDEKNGLFPYETDGLIFTPVDKSVGSRKLGILEKTKTWNLSFKWKPPQYNTIDFLVTTKKNDNGSDFVGNIFKDGQDLSKDNQITSFKTMILRVGFDERKHGFINPCEDLLQNNIYPPRDQKFNYKPAPFYPTDPTPDFPIHICHIPLKKKKDSLKMLTEDGKQEFSDNMIVEFRFDKDSEENWQWKPIRVRYDKTADLRSSGRNFGNAYHVAQSVWRSINYPITEEIIKTGENILLSNNDENVYYNRKSKETNTKSLRDFHNKFVKKRIINAVSKKGDILMDMSVGKAGDIQKWLDSKLSFVFGIDFAKDNIENRMDGSCARYIKMKRKIRNMFDAIFIHGNSSLNIQNTTAAFTSKSKMILNAIYGRGAKDREKLGEGLYKCWGKGKNGFDVISNQFSIHYFFQNNRTLNEFLRNCSENCKIGGYKVGTCYDGGKIFDKLKQKKNGENIFHVKDKKKIWSITKKYENTTFPNDEKCLGYTIDVFQESINKNFEEYLVNFDYFITMMIKYGFALLSKDEAAELGLPNSVGSFEELFSQMKTENDSGRMKKQYIGDALAMSDEEKDISFLNNYFVFKKIRNVNVQNVFEIEMAKTEHKDFEGASKSKDMIRDIMAQRIQRVFIRKFKKKFLLPTK
tara:strand:- start:5653 stop:9036 length:3384 start_codon:yes stop_codon:yes gene_type:complete